MTDEQFQELIDAIRFNTAAVMVVSENVNALVNMACQVLEQRGWSNEDLNKALAADPLDNMFYHLNDINAVYGKDA